MQAGDTDKGGDAPAVQPQETAFVGMNGEVTSKFHGIWFMKLSIKMVIFNTTLEKVTGLGFATRDQGAKVEEDQGLLEFTFLTNDGYN